MSAKSLGIGLIGCGTVGSGVVRLLQQEADLYRRRLGRAIELRRVLVRPQDLAYKTGDVPAQSLTSDPAAFFATPGLDLVVEAAGGTTQAFDLVRQALEMGKHVVTANKALIALRGTELFALARSKGVAIGFEASCAGGIPIITAMQFNLCANRITALYGILNGTCNYILTQMTSHQRSYAQALAEAQAAGYAEADPSLDVGGDDSAHKLAILSSLAFSVRVSQGAIPCRGIDGLDGADIRCGAELGYVIKLLAIGEVVGSGLGLAVAPCFLHGDEPLARVNGPFNALSLYGHAVGHTLYYGRGAGQMPTASAVVGDILNIASGAYTQAFANLALWPDQQPPAVLVDPDEISARFYLRVNATDSPGVLGQICSLLGQESISIAALLQHESDQGRFVPVVITTHRTSAGAVRRAAQAIGRLQAIQGPPVVIRIVDMPQG